MSAALIFGLLFALMLTGMPISISLGLTVLTFLFTMTEVPIESVGLKLFSGLDNFGIMAIPFFILAGTFLTRGGVARRMIAFTTSLVGHLPGGLGLAGVAACAMFAAISGSSVATVVAIGSIMMPAMVDHGYPKRFGVGVISTSGALGILVPPSIILVLYGVSTNTSIGALFMAGIVPGVLLALMLAAVTFFVAQRNGYPKMPRATIGEQFKAFRESIWGLLLIAIVLGGIYGGVFTPTEGASVGAFIMLAIGLFRRTLGFDGVKQAILQTAETSAMIFAILLGAEVFNAFLALTQVPTAAAEMIAASGWAPYTVLVGLLLFYIVLGGVMDELAMILLTLPVFFPIVTALDFGMPTDDIAIWFGILVLIVVGIGMTCPPIGLNVFVVASLARDVPVTRIYRGVLPFVGADVIRLGICVAFPALSLYLVKLLN